MDFPDYGTFEHPVDVVLDTDTFNEIDDQFAIAYLVRSEPRLVTKAVCAAPFTSEKAATPKEGMEKSFEEARRLLELLGRTDIPLLRGSDIYLPGETDAVISDAARDLAQRAASYTPDNPLYVVAIGAITNVASALLLRPEIRDRIVVIWLGGHALHVDDTREFNMYQDVAAARVVFSNALRLVQVPCRGVTDVFTVTKPELEYWLLGKNALCDFLVGRVITEADSYAKGKPWSRVIWDVVAVSWLLNDGGRFLSDRTIPAPIPQYDNHYSFDSRRHSIRYVYEVHRDALMEDLFRKISQ